MNFSAACTNRGGEALTTWPNTSAKPFARPKKTFKWDSIVVAGNQVVPQIECGESGVVSQSTENNSRYKDKALFGFGPVAPAMGTNIEKSIYSGPDATLRN